MWVKQNKKGLMKGWWRQEIKYAIMSISYRLPFLKKFTKSTAKSRRQIITPNLKTQNVFHDQTI